jgi:tetratricopeptide (TPR) repeat protein
MQQSESPGITYQAFISYSHVDAKVAAWLHRALESYRIPAHLVARHGLASNRLVPVFRDRDELPTSDDLTASITAALRDSRHLVVVCSPAAAASRWVNAEIRQFRALRPDGRVLCLLTGEAGESFPPALLETGAGEPLAADLRPEADGRHDALLKLVAGLLGVRLDELKQRDAQRRQRRLVAIAGGAFAGMAVAVGLAVFALFAQQQAERAEQVAVREAERANQEARTAERTLGFLTEILREADPSRARGAEVPVREVLERAAERLATELADEPMVRAQLLESVGEIYDGLGAYDRAAELFATGVDVYREAAGPQDPRTLRARGLLAAAWWRLGRYDEAEPLMREVHAALLERLGPDHPDTLWALNQLANLQFRRGEVAAAEGLYRQIWEAHGRRDGAAARATLDALNNLANAVGSLGREEEAAEHFRFILARRTELQGGDHPRTLGAAANLASALTTLGQLEEAEALELATLETRRRVLGPEHPDTLTSLNNLARLYGIQGRPDEERALFREVVEVRTRVLGAQHPLTLEARVNLGMALSQGGAFAAAIEEFEAAGNGFAAIGEPAHPSSLLARTELAVALAQSGRNGDGEAVLVAVLPEIRATFGAGHRRALDVLYNLACLAARQGKTEPALDYLDALVAAGFRDPVLLEDPDLRPLHGLARFVEVARLLEDGARGGR